MISVFNKLVTHKKRAVAGRAGNRGERFIDTGRRSALV